MYFRNIVRTTNVRILASFRVNRFYVHGLLLDALKNRTRLKSYLKCSNLKLRK